MIAALLITVGLLAAAVIAIAVWGMVALAQDVD